MNMLDYQYQIGNGNSNLLLNVSDAVSNQNTGGFKDGNTNPALDDYEYDENGNMTKDRNKGITSITYNYLNLPELIIFENSNSIEYTYNAAGVKLKKTVIEETATPEVRIEVDYLDGFQYAGEVLNFFPTAEGYVRATPAGDITPGAPPTGYAYSYVYNYTDHLGNVRLSYSMDHLTGKLKILEENHYFPFGLRHEVYLTGSKLDFSRNPGDGIEPEPGLPPVLDYVTRMEYQYKYNGKEWQDELGLNIYDFEARMYDPTTGRTTSVDPLADTFSHHSPYSFFNNNPLRYTDPTGMAGDDVIIKGAYKNEAFKQMQASVKGQLDLTMNKDGKVTATAVEGAELNKASQTLLAATEDKNITVNLETTAEFDVKGNTFVGGSFRGSKINADGTVDATNVINTEVLKAIDSFFERGEGVGVLHETLEAYVGAQESPGAGPAQRQGNWKSPSYGDYEKAHNEALKIDPRAARTSDQRIIPGRTSTSSGNSYRTITLKKGTGGNKIYRELRREIKKK